MGRAEYLEAVSNATVFAVTTFFALVLMRSRRWPWLACVCTVTGAVVVLAAMAQWFAGGSHG